MLVICFTVVGQLVPIWNHVGRSHLIRVGSSNLIDILVLGTSAG